MAYNYLSHIQAVENYQTLSFLFQDISDQWLKPTLMKRFWQHFYAALKLIADQVDKSIDELLELVKFRKTNAPISLQKKKRDMKFIWHFWSPFNIIAERTLSPDAWDVRPFTEHNSLKTIQIHTHMTDKTILATPPAWNLVN